MKKKKEFAVAVATVVIVYVVLGIPYALIAPSQSMLLERLVVLYVLSAAMLTFWMVRYKQTSHDLETLWKEIERAKILHEKPRTPCVREVNQKERDK